MINPKIEVRKRMLLVCASPPFEIGMLARLGDGRGCEWQRAVGGGQRRDKGNDLSLSLTHWPELSLSLSHSLAGVS